jgi:hypothetical protein
VCRGAEKQPVAPAQLGAAGLALHDSHLVTKNKDLDLPVALIVSRLQEAWFPSDSADAEHGACRVEE